MIGIVIAVVVIVALVMFFNGYQNRYQSFQGKVYNFIVISLLIFLVVTVGYVATSTNFKVNGLGDLVSFAKLYFSWVAGLFSNGKSIVGYSVQQNWAFNSTGG